MKRAKDKGRLWAGKALAAVLLVAVVLAGSGLWLLKSRSAAPSRTRMLYSARGFGGFVHAGSAPAPSRTREHSTEALQPAQDAYDRGDYRQAETAAQKIITQAKAARPGSKESHQGLQALQLAAYSAARRNDFQLSQQRFAALRDAASELPDHGQQASPPGEPSPTLEEEAAYEHAVCTGKLQGEKAAEQELSGFMRRYPQSLLVQAAAKRIARYHKGDLPKDVEKLWQQAMHLQQATERRREREASLCGPECLAELLRRQGRKADVHALAEAMGTTDKGTSLAGLAKVAKRYGFSPRGLLLSERGLEKQALPAIAWADLGHFVLVEAASPARVEVWDPEASGMHHPGRKSYTIAEWQQRWNGYTLALR